MNKGLKKPKIYLAGGIQGLSYADANAWRLKVTELLKPEIETINPLTKENMIIKLLWEGKGMPKKESSIESYPPWACNYIVWKDLKEIKSSSGILVYLPKNVQRPYFGTSMEIFYTSYVLKRPVFVFGDSKNRSPWINSFCIALTDTMEEAVTLIKGVLL